jgi:hypothetical protein
VHSNGTALITTKSPKHDHLVNTNLLVKYNEPINMKKPNCWTIKTKKLKTQTHPNSHANKIIKEVFHQVLMVVQ